uniref:Uncharacterized protein n=1 Tax=Anguilla anguilla TaxID=7936 RepID=A0A0E9XBN2_ANGAN
MKLEYVNKPGRCFKYQLTFV